MSVQVPTSEIPVITSSRRRWAALAVLMLPVLLVSVDNTVLSFALPALSTALQPSGTALLWIVDVYPLLLAGLLVPMGSLGDRIGRRRLLLIGAAGFAAVSAVAAFAPTAGALIALRAAMGVFGAMLMPATLSLIRNIFLDPEERRIAIAVWAAGFSGARRSAPSWAASCSSTCGGVRCSCWPCRCWCRCWCSARCWCRSPATRGRVPSTPPRSCW